MDLHKLDVFCRLIELKSFTRTAEAVRLSQPTVSEHIRSLEEQLETRLVDRLGRRVEPTPVGMVLYRKAKKLLRLHQETLQTVQEFSGRISGRILIGSGTIPGTYLLPALISRFRTLHPAIRATLFISSSRAIAQRVQEGELDLGLVGARWNETALTWQTLFTDELTLAVPPDHAWAKREEVDCSELAGQPFIFREPGSGTRRVVAQLLREHGLNEHDLDEVAEIGSTVAVKEAIRAGIGVSILSRRAVRDDAAAGRLHTPALKNVSLVRPFYLITRRRRQLGPVAGAFADFLQNQDNHADGQT